MTRILLVGYYGCGNKGDDWLLKKSVRLLRAHFPTAKVCAIYPRKEIPKSASAPFESSSILGELTYCPRFSWLRLLLTIIRSTHIVFGGGGLLQDQTSRLSLWYYALIGLIATLFKKKVWLLGQGIGPVLYPSSRWVLRHLFNRVALFVVRDEGSLQFATDISPRSTPTLSADLAFYNGDVQTESKATTQSVAGVCLLQRIPRPFLNSIVGELTQGPYELLQIIADEKKDLDLFDQPTLADHLIAQVYLGAHHEFFHFKGIITMRYHVAVWAALHAIPFLAISDSDKLTDLARQLGQPFVQLGDTLPAESIPLQIQAFWDTLTPLSILIQEKTPSLISRTRVLEDLLRSA